MVPEKTPIESLKDTQPEIEALEQTSTENEESFFEELGNKPSTVLSEINGMEKKYKRNVAPLFVRRFYTIIALFVVLVLLIVGGIVFKNKPSSDKPVEEETETFEYVDNSTSLKQTDSNNIEKIVIDGSYGKLVLVLEKNKKYEEDKTQNEFIWVVEGYEQELLGTSEVNAAVSTFTSIESTRTMVEKPTEKDLKDHGFNKPTATATVYVKKGDNFTLTIGDIAPNESGYYAMITGDPKIYLLSKGNVDSFNVRPEDLADSVIVNTPQPEDFEKKGDQKKYFSEDTGMFATFDSIEISGSKYGQKAVITPISDNDFVEYNINLGDYTRYADPDAVNEIFGIMTNGLVAIDTYAFKPDAATIKKYGLDDPYAFITINYGPFSTKIKVGAYDAEQDRYAVMVEGRNAIYAVYSDAILMLQYDLKDYYYQFVFQEFIFNFKNITVETDGKIYDFEIKSKPDDGTFIARCNGVRVDDALLSTYYQYFLLLEPEVKESYSDGEVALKATFTYTGGAKKVIELVSQSTRRYLVRIDGKDYGIVNSTYFENLKNYAEYVVIDRGIPEPA